MIFGYGLGSAYREIYILDPNINIGVYRSLINLNYDIENGHITLLYRLGIFGWKIISIWIFKHFKNYNLMIFIYLLIDFIGASKIGITPCLELFSLGLLVSFYQKIKEDSMLANATFKIMTSFFSIITVSKNNYKELKQTLDSIKSLKSDNFEWIPVLSGNCSSSLNLVSKKYSFKVNPTINQDKNLWDAMNIGINKSVNKYLIFMNAGDTFYDKYVLSKISIIINNHNYPDLIYGNTVELINGTKNYKKSLNHKFIKYGMFANHQSIFFKKKYLINMI